MPLRLSLADNVTPNICAAIRRDNAAAKQRAMAVVVRELRCSERRKRAMQARLATLVAQYERNRTMAQTFDRAAVNKYMTQIERAAAKLLDVMENPPMEQVPDFLLREVLENWNNHEPDFLASSIDIVRRIRDEAAASPRRQLPELIKGRLPDLPLGTLIRELEPHV